MIIICFLIIVVEVILWSGLKQIKGCNKGLIDGVYLISIIITLIIGFVECDNERRMLEKTVKQQEAIINEQDSIMTIMNFDTLPEEEY